MDWRARLARWFGRGAAGTPPRAADDHLGQAADSLRALLDDRSIPADLRESLAAD